MRNLILFAVAFGVVLSETDVEELGSNVSEIDFKNYFGIPQETEQNSGFVKSEGFAISDLSEWMNEEEKAELAKELPVSEEAVEANAETATEEAPAAEAAPATEKAPKLSKEEKAAATAKAKADKATAAEKAKADKAAVVAEPKKPGVIASILDVIAKSTTPVNEEQIVTELAVLFPEKEKNSMRNTVRAQIGGKTQPVRMETEKKVTFVITEVAGKEGEKATKFYAVAKA